MSQTVMRCSRMKTIDRIIQYLKSLGVNAEKVTRQPKSSR